jgi:streptogramin lyase
VDAVVPTDLYPCASVQGGGFMWVTAYGSAEVHKVDPATNEVVATFETDGQPCGVVFAGGSLWVGSVKGALIDQIDPSSGEILGRVTTGGQVYDVQAGYGSVWVVNREGGDVLRIDPATAKIVASVSAGGLLYGLAVNADGVWASSQLENTIVHVDPETNEIVDTITDPINQPFTFAWTPGSLWVSHRNGVVSQLDTRIGKFVARVDTPHDGSSGDPDSAGGFVWYPDGVSGDLLRIDPEAAKVTAQVPLDKGFSVAQAGFDSVWVARFGGDGLARIDPGKV